MQLLLVAPPLAYAAALILCTPGVYTFEVVAGSDCALRACQAQPSRGVVVVVETLRSTFVPGNHLSATLDNVQLLMMVCASPPPTRPTRPAIRRRRPPPKCLRPNYIESVLREACVRREAVCGVRVRARYGGTGLCAARRSGGCGRA